MKKSDTIIDELAKLEAAHGRLTPEIVVRAASNKKSPLHSRFIWNDKVAAHRQRLDTAREILATYVTVTITRTKRQVSVPYYIRDPNAPPAVASYVRTEAERTRDQAEVILQNEIDRIVGCVNRARDIAEVLDQSHPGIAAKMETLLQTTLSVRTFLAAAE